MAITMLNAVEFSRIPSLQFVIPVVSSDPTAYEAGLIYNVTSKQVKYHNGTAWITLGAAGSGGPPSGAAGGDLTGSYPDPQIAPGVIMDADVSTSAAISMGKISGLDAALASKALHTTAFTAGAGLIGGGDLSTSRTFDVAGGPGITVNADNIQLDQLFTDNLYINTAGDTMVGTLVLSAVPTNPNDAVYKSYVDMLASGFTFKLQARVLSYDNLASLSGLPVIDTVQLVEGDRVLVVGQTNQVQNGIWIAHAAAWTRATDADAEKEIKKGVLLTVGEGTRFNDTVWICYDVEPDPWVPEVGASMWTPYTSLKDLVAGNGLVRNGVTIDIVAADGTITLGPDSIAVASAPKWTTARTFALTGDVVGTATIDGSANISMATTVAGVAGVAKHFAADVPAGTICPIVHSLGTQDVSVQVFRKTSPFDTVLCDVERTDTVTVTLKFSVAVSAGQFRVVIQGR